MGVLSRRASRKKGGLDYGGYTSDEGYRKLCCGEILAMIPLGNRVFLKDLPDDEVMQKTDSGLLWLPDSALEWQRYRQWIVVAVGPRVREPNIRPGMRVIITKWAGVGVDIDGEEYRVALDQDIICSIKEEA
jgi:co-chaperonin GroES (HSP10)